MVTSVSFSPDGSRIISASWDHKISVWDVNARKEAFEPLKQDDLVYSVAYSPDGKMIVSAGGDNLIRMWDAQSGMPLCKPLIGHTHRIMNISYSPNGRYIASGSEDKTVRIWDIELALQSRNPSETSNVNENVASNTAVLDSDEKLPPDSDISVIQGDFEPQPDSDGWVRYNGGLLFWVAEDCRNGLISQAVMTMPNGPQRVIRLDFSRFRYGSAWASVYKP
jgi:WD40 repeat protein